MQMACDKCGGATALAGEIQPLGQQAGARMFQCSACGHMNWSKLHPRGLAESQAQEQQQPQPTNNRDGGAGVKLARWFALCHLLFPPPRRPSPVSPAAVAGIFLAVGRLSGRPLSFLSLTVIDGGKGD
jgi:hypothetical protein